MKYAHCASFTAQEMDVLLQSLISRRISIKNILFPGQSSPIYEKELETVEGLLEKLFPGSLKAIRNTEKVA